MTTIKESLIGIMYPRRCPICGNIVIPKSESACVKCRLKLNPIQEPRCKKCSKPLLNEEQEYCFDCQRQQHHYEKGYAVYTYEESIKDSLIQYKFYGKREFAKFYVESIISELGDKLLRLQPDVIVPVPLHKRKLRIRGFNQAELLAKGIGDALSIPLHTDWLERVKYTTPQKKLNDKERLRNLERAFLCRADTNDIIGKCILLVDDIYTTGSTIEACTRVLLQAGCSKVYFVTICIGKGF